MHGDKTTTGATILSTLPNHTEHGRAVVRVGDRTTTCPKCNQSGVIVDGESHSIWDGVAAAVDRSIVRCGCPEESNRIIAPKGQWMGAGKSPEQQAAEKQAALMIARQAEREAQAQQQAEERDRNRVFAKSCLRGDGCNDAGDAREPHTHFAEMGLFRVTPTVNPATENDVPQYAQTAKKKPSTPEETAPKPRGALYKWWFGNHEEVKYQAVTAAAASAVRAQAATAGAGVLEQVAGRFATSGTWAVTAGRVLAAGPGAPIAALLVGMMPGRLNDGEQDFIDRMRAEQMREVPSRVRFTWENNPQGNPVPRGWHTPPGKDMVRLRRMEWDNSRKAYTFTTEEDNPITIIWTPDHSGVNVPSNTGNQARPVLPSSVIVDPLPESTGITTTTSPAPEEKSFADYILILPMPNIPPIYIYLSKPPVEFLEVELYSDFKRRSRQGKYEADHIPSRAAVERYYMEKYPTMDIEQIAVLTDQVAAIVIPKEVHHKISETYGGRNSEAQIQRDSGNLRSAVDRNVDAIKPALKEHGASDAQIEAARSRMHELNSDIGLYK
ncbi:S-type pyocin domain-containing protein [Acerihabitans sp. TG2]|uniref:S-type pyocin domain-containing protein n=1 Tax=Acerihabitans sp. TG2 TaxID=3096008 RepID=UPI002B230EBF|nr:S-type pyocin domain-containing protein [Acerihabitans sp. TG2]MEA9390592.1 S-type pyocin domain-containing protein [Acerihabitans sp. TG2]